MAVGVPTINTTRYDIHRPIRARGLRIIQGDVVFSANSSFVASTIERRFRFRCRDIQFSLACGVVMHYVRSAVHKYGKIFAYGIESGAATVSVLTGMKMPAAVNSGTFVAVGT